MIVDFFANLGAWGWLFAGLLLLALEIIVPGYFFLWIGSAAIAVGLIGLVGMQGAGLWTVSMQFIAFALLSIMAVVVGRRFYDPTNTDSEEPLLNRRAAQLIGKKATLIEAINHGTGRAKVGDTIWRVEGPDAAIGTVMIITEAHDDVLIVTTR